MRISTVIIGGAIVGGLLLIGGSVAVHIGRGLAERAAAQVPGYDSPDREKHSTTNSPFDLCMAIGRPYGCEDFRFATTSADEKEAGSAIVGGRKVRVAMYPSETALLDAVAASGGKDRAGRPLTILAGGNWTLTYQTQPGESPAFAKSLALRMDGQWIDPADLGWSKEN
jgi:hypothetical protein